MKTAGTDIDYTETLRKTFGKRGYYGGMTAFIIMLTIPIILYFQLLSQFLFSILLPIIEIFNHEDHIIDPKVDFEVIDFSKFSYSWTCLLIFIVLFILTARRDLSIFIKINTFGVIFTIIVILFIITYGLIGLAKGGYEYDTFVDNKEDETLGNGKVVLFATAYSHLMGTLGGGFYLHNISLPIYRNSKNPDTAVRDMFLGFFVVMLSYCVCGTLGVYGF